MSNIPVASRSTQAGWGHLLTLLFSSSSAAVNNSTNEGVAIKKVTNVFSKKILAKRALREIKLLQHFRGHRNVSVPGLYFLLRPAPLSSAAAWHHRRVP